MPGKTQFDMIAISSNPVARRPIGIKGIFEYTITQDAAAVLTADVGAESFTLTGVKVGDHVLSVIPPTIPAGMGVGQPYVTAANTVIVPLINPTVGTLNPSSGVWTFLVAETGDF